MSNDFVIAIASGKGGVDKSTIAANLTAWLSMQNKKVGLLDIDIHGPSIPKLLNLEHKGIRAERDKIKAICDSDTLKIMSIGLLLLNKTNAVMWRGPMKRTLIKQFVTDVCWRQLDYLVVDCPPGTGDEPLSIVQLLENADGAIIVTTPQQIAVIDVKKCITFCKKLNLAVLGIIENMSGLICPHCQNKIDIFKSGGGKQMAKEFNEPFLGSIPIDADMVSSCDLGQAFIYSNSQSPAAQALISAFKPLLQHPEQIEIKKEVKVK